MCMCLFLFVLCSSCKNSDKDSIIKLVDEWKNKEILIPSHISFISCGDSLIRKDNITYKDYTVVTYVDSVGCISCKLQLRKWKQFMSESDSVAKANVSYLFIFHPQKRDNKELISLLQKDHFTYPVCIDEDDSFNKLNHFPSDMAFQTFLVDKNKKVLAIGNPVHNPKIKELYLNIITGEKSLTNVNSQLLTTAALSTHQLDMGTFDWHKEQIVEFSLINSGNNLLVIDDILSSCGCITVEYSKEPIQSGNSLNIKVRYKAERSEHFDKTITVYCNTKDSPYQLKIAGNAK